MGGGCVTQMQGVRRKSLLLTRTDKEQTFEYPEGKEVHGLRGVDHSIRFSVSHSQ